MKKILLTILTLSLVLSIVACNDKVTPTEKGNNGETTSPIEDDNDPSSKDEIEETQDTVTEADEEVEEGEHDELSLKLENYLQALADGDEKAAIDALLIPEDNAIPTDHIKLALESNVMTIPTKAVATHKPSEVQVRPNGNFYAVIFKSSEGEVLYETEIFKDTAIDEEGSLTVSGGRTFKIPYFGDLSLNGKIVEPDEVTEKEGVDPDKLMHELTFNNLHLGNYTVGLENTYIVFDEVAISTGDSINTEILKTYGSKEGTAAILQEEILKQTAKELNGMMQPMIADFNDAEVTVDTLSEMDFSPELKQAIVETFLKQNGMKKALVKGVRRVDEITTENKYKFIPLDKNSFEIHYEYELVIDESFTLTNTAKMHYEYKDEVANLTAIEFIPESA